MRARDRKAGVHCAIEGGTLDSGIHTKPLSPRSPVMGRSRDTARATTHVLVHDHRQHVELRIRSFT